MAIGRGLGKVLDILGEILAVLTIIVIAFGYINAKFELVTDPLFVEILAYVWKYAILGTVIIVGMGVTLKRNIIFFILFCAIAAVAVVFSFFPDAVPQFLR
jgi:hypothetical protein